MIQCKPEDEDKLIAAVDVLDDAIDKLGVDELRVLAALATRLLMGQGQYGYLDIANDNRSWGLELANEQLDACAYAAIASLKVCK